MVVDEDGKIHYEQRKEPAEVDSLNITEKKRFMNGDKLV